MSYSGRCPHGYTYTDGTVAEWCSECKKEQATASTPVVVNDPVRLVETIENVANELHALSLFRGSHALRSLADRLRDALDNA